MMAEPSTQSRVYFQSPSKENEAQSQRKLGKFTVRYDRKDLQRRLDIEEWLDFQLHQLYGCEEEEIPDLEIDIDELLEISDEDQRSKLQEMLHECCKPTDDFINELLLRIKGLRKMTVSQKK
ncbi:protein phosphatase 1 regulatory subunit 14C [Stegostoma tigrinum]|uniref:protein phosphatase 1 regulatory subunit 14C n=1 Tax=Stegostoma tigrinum TaxID=3053191 RepID=UPI00202B975D|nr:protein phosphatase 1 regulatory subunit 14C [Stegostoma tigrinum]